MGGYPLTGLCPGTNELYPDRRWLPLITLNTPMRKCFEDRGLTMEVWSVAADIIYEHPIRSDRGAAGSHRNDLTVVAPASLLSGREHPPSN